MPYQKVVTFSVNTYHVRFDAIRNPCLERECYSTRTWNAASAHNVALPGSSVMRKPDLVLSDDVTTRWGNIKVSGELTHSPYMPAIFA